MRFLLSFQQESENKMDQVPPEVLQKQNKNYSNDTGKKKQGQGMRWDVKLIVSATSVPPSPPTFTPIYETKSRRRWWK